MKKEGKEALVRWPCPRRGFKRYHIDLFLRFQRPRKLTLETQTQSKSPTTPPPDYAPVGSMPSIIRARPKLKTANSRATYSLCKQFPSPPSLVCQHYIQPQTACLCLAADKPGWLVDLNGRRTLRRTDRLMQNRLALLESLLVASMAIEQGTPLLPLLPFCPLTA